MPQSIRFLSDSDVHASLSMPEAIELMAEAFVLLSNDDVHVPLRSRVSLSQPDSFALFMPVSLRNRFGVKVVSMCKGNPTNGLPMVQGFMLLLDGDTGEPLAMMNAERLTALRTGAASGLATKLLSRQDSSIAAIFGAGTQGRAQLEGICAVCDIRKVFLFDPSKEKTRAFIDELAPTLPVEIRPAVSSEVLKNVDIVCTATTSTSPLFSLRDVKPGVHINGVGSYRPDMQEIPSEVVANALLFVDQRKAALAEAGDIAVPVQRGLIRADHIKGELGELLSKTVQGRTADSDITFFKSVGNAVQDIVAAGKVLENAIANGRGTEVVF